MANQRKILLAIRDASPKGLSAAELQKATGIWSGRLYVDLMSLETRGMLQSYWVDGPYPRRRLYYLGERLK